MPNSPPPSLLKLNLIGIDSPSNRVPLAHGGRASAFQSLVQSGPPPVQDPRFAHNGGSAPYPLNCQRFTEPADAWIELDRLHQQGTPYNLVYGRNCMQLIARVPQDSDKLSAQSRGMAGARWRGQ